MLSAYAQGSAQASQTSQSSILGSPIFMMIIIFAIFYFVLLRPQKRQQDDHKKMLSGLKKNDQVVTNGGIHGTIVNVKDNTVVLKIDDNVKVELQKGSVATLKKSRQEKETQK